MVKWEQIFLLQYGILSGQTVLCRKDRGECRLEGHSCRSGGAYWGWEIDIRLECLHLDADQRAVKLSAYSQSTKFCHFQSNS